MILPLVFSTLQSRKNNFESVVWSASVGLFLFEGRFLRASCCLRGGDGLYRELVNT